MRKIKDYMSEYSIINGLNEKVTSRKRENHYSILFQNNFKASVIVTTNNGEKDKWSIAVFDANGFMCTKMLERYNICPDETGAIEKYSEDEVCTILDFIKQLPKYAVWGADVWNHLNNWE